MLHIYCIMYSVSGYSFPDRLTYLLYHVLGVWLFFPRQTYIFIVSCTRCLVILSQTDLHIYCIMYSVSGYSFPDRLTYLLLFTQGTICPKSINIFTVLLILTNTIFSTFSPRRLGHYITSRDSPI